MSELSKDEHDELLRLAQSRTLPAGDVFRARLMLALAEGKPWRQIEVELHTSRPTIARWKRRFEELGLAGLEPRHKGSEPRAATPAVQARVLRKTTQPLDVPKDGRYARSEQIDGTAYLAPSPTQTPPVGSVYGE